MSSRHFDLVVSSRARLELADIAALTERDRGAEQARRYIAMLERSLEFIEHRPFASRARDELAPSLRSHLAEGRRHVIYFRIDEEKGVVRIMRVIHVRRNPATTDWGQE